MTDEEKRRLLKEIASVAEDAYRRGFQHGFCTASGKYDAVIPTEDDVEAWRLAANRRMHAVGPPGTPWAGMKSSKIERLDMESETEYSTIQKLLLEVFPVGTDKPGTF